MEGRAIPFTLHGVPVWLREETLEVGNGPLMPTPTHDDDVGPFGDSYAHLCDDGMIRRYREVIGSRDDLTPVVEG